jgi:hypothetical protein
MESVIYVDIRGKVHIRYSKLLRKLLSLLSSSQAGLFIRSSLVAVFRQVWELD